LKFKVGDLLIREHDKCPCLVVEVAESTKKEWGTLDANRRQYRECQTRFIKSLVPRKPRDPTLCSAGNPE